MQGKLFALIALVLMMIEPSTQGIQLTTRTVVGNVLFEQYTVYALALLMLIVALVMWSFIKHLILKLTLFLKPILFDPLLPFPCTLLQAVNEYSKNKIRYHKQLFLFECRYLLNKLINDQLLYLFFIFDFLSIFYLNLSHLLIHLLKNGIEQKLYDKL